MNNLYQKPISTLKQSLFDINKCFIQEFQVWIIAAFIQASIDFNDQAVPVPLTTTCTDGNTAITGTFSVNIVDKVCILSYESRYQA
ncbi:hypothetical protein DPMN_190759 [Dreissena polymorpha]|uniref:Uncharacterized protein n=1 Tax=Dreissena polymorpha TaxID=45954 RepID=A0A9D4BE92_DREPO|nr:hypothetical protein DPMN_190759 [Dreissena polymorpha]